MQVETFECEETKEETPEISDAAIAIIQKLGLEGQSKLIGNTEDEPRPSRCPYRKMTAEEAFVYRTLCPSTSTLKEFSEGPIPLRVLQVAAHATALDVFERLIVWHVAGPAVKDPVLVGVKKHPTRTWQDDFFILARWGDVLDEYPFMLKQAVQRWKDKVKSMLTEIRSDVERDLATVEALSLDRIVAASEPTYNGIR